MLFKYLVTLVAIGVSALWAGGVRAADIQFFPDEKVNVIVVKGQFELGDEAKFAAIAIEAKTGLVILDSPGGALLPALEIGKLIQIRGFATFVPNNTKCVSACALIWVAGEKRFLAPSAQVGFHASYRDQAGKLEEAGVANALVGRYLTLLNLPERAVVFATSASPYDVLWLSSVDASSVGMPFTTLDLDTPPNPLPVYTAPSPPVTASAPQEEETASWYFAGSVDGSKWYVRGKDVMNGSADSRRAEMWIKTDDSENRDVAWRSTMTRYVLDCANSSYSSDFHAAYDADGKTTSKSTSLLSGKVVPETLLEGAAQLVCTDEHPGSDPQDIP